MKKIITLLASCLLTTSATSLDIENITAIYCGDDWLSTQVDMYDNTYAIMTIHGESGINVSGPASVLHINNGSGSTIIAATLEDQGHMADLEVAVYEDSDYGSGELNLEHAGGSQSLSCVLY